MLFPICMLLACIQLAKADYMQNIPPLQPPFFCNNNDLIKTIAHKVELLEVSNQNIQLKVQASNNYIFGHFEELKTAIYAIDHGHKDKPKDCECNTNTTTSSNLATSSAAGGFNIQNASASSSAIQINLCQSGRNGIQLIQIPNSELSPFFVNCIPSPQQTNDSWILIQRRRSGSIDFYRKWFDYQQGFGNLEDEFFMGLDKIHALTQSALYELWIHMEDFSNQTRWARYSTFAIGGQNQAYALNVLGKYTGNAGDSLTHHAGQKFTTRDLDHDESEENCAQLYAGAWWYKNCHRSNLNGKFLHDEHSKSRTDIGIIWEAWHGRNYSLKYVHMAIRPVKLS